MGHHFRLGRVISRLFRSIRQHRQTIAIIYLICVFLSFAKEILLSANIAGAEEFMMDILLGDHEALAIGISLYIIWYLIRLIVLSFFEGAIMFGILRSFKKDHRGTGQLFRAGLRKTLPLTGLNLIFFAIPFCIYLAVLYLGYTGGVILRSAIMAASPVLGIISIILTCTWIVSGPVLVVEKDMGIVTACKRSARLTRGYRMWMFLALILYVITIVVGSIVTFAVLALFLQVVPIDSAVALSLISSCFDTAISVASLVLAYAGCASIYYELRFFRP